MELKLDLHIHSQRSPDGRMTLEEIVSAAKKAGLHGAAVCDHDCVVKGAPEFSDFLLIPGVEVSTDKGHLLGLFVSEPIETRDFFQAAGAIHAQGGMAVLAHPFEHNRDSERLISLIPFLDGVETWNGRANRKNPQANAMAAEFAKSYSLRPFAGSDAHVPQEIGAGVTTISAEAMTPEAVKAALLKGGAVISGRCSPARYAAASQLTKRKKSGASPASYMKWALFAAKCCAQDLIKGAKR